MGGRLSHAVKICHCVGRGSLNLILVTYVPYAPALPSVLREDTRSTCDMPLFVNSILSISANGWTRTAEIQIK